MSYQLTKLTPDLWVGQSALFNTNSGVFVSNGQALLIDPCIYPHEIDAIASFLHEQGVAAIALVLTHSHWDHILGPEHFPGMWVIAQQKYLEVAAEHGAEIVGDVTAWMARTGVQRETPFVLPIPDETFGEAMEVAVGDLRLRLAHAPGHSPDMLAIYHETSGTLWASDILSDIEIPGVAASLGSYERTLTMLAGWNIAALVPGHGTPTADRTAIAARLRRDMAYLAQLRSLLEAAIGAGKSLTEAHKLGAAITYWLPEDNDEIHQSNIETVYKELSGA